MIGWRSRAGTLLLRIWKTQHADDAFVRTFYARARLAADFDRYGPSLSRG